MAHLVLILRYLRFRLKLPHQTHMHRKLSIAFTTLPTVSRTTTTINPTT